MKTTFPAQLAMLNANAGSPIDLERIQNVILRDAVNNLKHQLNLQSRQIEEQTKQLVLLNANFERRTSQWTPIRVPEVLPRLSNVLPAARQLVFADDLLQRSPSQFSQGNIDLDPAVVINANAVQRASDDGGVYTAPDNTLRGFVVPSPSSNASPRPRTQVDLVLPPLDAFCNPGRMTQICANFYVNLHRT